MRSIISLQGLVLLGLFLLAFPIRVSAEGESFPVTRIDVRTRYRLPPPETYFPLIPLEKGRRTTVEQIRSIEQTLKRSGLFRTVSVRIGEEEGGKSVSFDLWQIERVGRIKIKGNWLVLTSSIHRVLSMQEGDPFDETALAGDLEHIRSLYEKKGWYDTAVTVDREQVPEDGSIRLSYRIKRGHHIRFGPIELEGVENGDPEEIRKILRIWPWVTTKRLNNRIRKVADYYGRLGYPVARVRVQGLETGERKETPLLRIRIKEGKRLLMDVKGNEALSARKILEATTFFANQGYGLFDAEDSTQSIEQLYEQKGFPNAQVTFKRKETDRQVRISFTVDEGERIFIRGIVFEGNQAVPEKVLSRHVLTRPRNLLLLRRGTFLSETWEQDRNSLINEYTAILLC